MDDNNPPTPTTRPIFLIIFSIFFAWFSRFLQLLVDTLLSIMGQGKWRLISHLIVVLQFCELRVESV